MKESSKFSLPSVVKKGVVLKNIDYVYNIMPIHIISRIFGLVPFGIARSPNGEVEGARVNKFDILWFVVSILLYLFLAYSYIDTNELQFSSNESFILTAGDNVLIALGLVSAAVVIVMDMYNRSRIVEILKQFILFDKRVSLLKKPFSFKILHEILL